jgi:sulfite reductase (ferredoxin)
VEFTVSVRRDLIKLPLVKDSEQLVRIKVSDEYSTGRLHITTRQDIQIHYVSLDRTQLWAQLAIDDIVMREAWKYSVLQQVN